LLEFHFISLHRTGETGRIQATESTADLLCAAGKETWVNKRPDSIVGDDGGSWNTFWVHARTSDSISTLSVATSASKTVSLPVPRERMVDWFSDKLGEILTEVLMMRQKDSNGSDLMDQNLAEAKAQIKSFVETIWSLYSDLPFHNFEKAFHVASTLSKMLDQIQCDIPLLERFSAMFASLIYEVDHPGLDNEHMVNRGEAFPKGKSITQNHAFELSWAMLSDPKYKELCTVLCPASEDFTRFANLTQGCVICTDVMNPMLSAARKRRWEQIFDRPCEMDDSETLERSNPRKTKAMLEHLMLAAHLTHTTQSWSFYIDWTGRLFQETVAAFMEGKVSTDPADYWFDKELMLFDNIVLPLLATLEDAEPCAAIASELLARAERNRDEWKTKGKGTVVDMRLDLTGEKRVCFA
jgi:hypothetical protein